LNCLQNIARHKSTPVAIKAPLFVGDMFTHAKAFLRHDPYTRCIWIPANHVFQMLNQLLAERGMTLFFFGEAFQQVAQIFHRSTCRAFTITHAQRPIRLDCRLLDHFHVVSNFSQTQPHGLRMSWLLPGSEFDIDIIAD